MQAGEFGCSPCLIPSLSGPAVEKAVGSLAWSTGELSPADHLLLCTDAVAAYLLREIESSGKKRGIESKAQDTPCLACSDLLGIRSIEEFREWITKARAEGLRNDDSTIIIAGRKC